MRALLATMILLLVAGCGRSEPPHVFVFLVDTLRAGHLGCYGYERPTSPNLDAFAEDAFVFRNAYSPSPWTRPAVAALFTGLPPQLHGVRGQAGYLPPAAITWAERMTDAGYHCASWFTNAHLAPKFGLHQGFAEYRYEERQGRAYAPAPTLLERWLRDLDAQPVDRPLMHYLHFLDPHRPYTPLRKYRLPFVSDTEPALEWYTRAQPDVSRVRFFMNAYDAEILQVDDSFGDFLQELRARGWYENSWIVFVSDHGEEFYEHDYHGHGNGLWENLLRVPLVIRPPGGRGGAEAHRLERLVEDHVPIHAVADIVAGPGRPGLGAANLDALGVVAPLETIPTPDRPAPAVRRASFSLDGQAGISVGEGATKLTWYDNPSPRWFASDLESDPAERADSGARPERLRQEVELWASLGWRGLELTNGSDDTVSIALRTEPRENLEEARVPVGESPPRFRLLRRPTNRELEWTSLPGQSVILRIDPGTPLLQRSGEEWVPFVDERLMQRRVGPADVPTGERPTMDPALEQKLRALGYLN